MIVFTVFTNQSYKKFNFGIQVPSGINRVIPIPRPYILGYEHLSNLEQSLSFWQGVEPSSELELLDSELRSIA